MSKNRGGWSNSYSALVTEARPEHVALFVALQGRAKDLPGGVLNVDDLEKHGFRRVEAIAYLKKLAEVGLGKFLVGRRKLPSRFVWNTSAKEFAREFIARKQRLANGQDCLPSGDMHSHRFLLRPGLQVEFALPQNLSPDEANRLADFIKTLPF